MLLRKEQKIRLIEGFVLFRQSIKKVFAKVKQI